MSIVCIVELNCWGGFGFSSCVVFLVEATPPCVEPMETRSKRSLQHGHFRFCWEDTVEILHAHVPPPPVPRGKFRGAPASTAEEVLRGKSLGQSVQRIAHSCPESESRRMRSMRSSRQSRSFKKRSKSFQDGLGSMFPNLER